MFVHVLLTGLQKNTSFVATTTRVVKTWRLEPGLGDLDAHPLLAERHCPGSQECDGKRGLGDGHLGSQIGIGFVFNGKPRGNNPPGWGPPFWSK